MSAMIKRLFKNIKWRRVGVAALLGVVTGAVLLVADVHNHRNAAQYSVATKIAFLPFVVSVQLFEGFGHLINSNGVVINKVTYQWAENIRKKCKESYIREHSVKDQTSEDVLADYAKDHCREAAKYAGKAFAMLFIMLPLFIMSLFLTFLWLTVVFYLILSVPKLFHFAQK